MADGGDADLCLWPYSSPVLHSLDGQRISQVLFKEILGTVVNEGPVPFMMIQEACMLSCSYTMLSS